MSDVEIGLKDGGVGWAEHRQVNGTAGNRIGQAQGSSGFSAKFKRVGCSATLAQSRLRKPTQNASCKARLAHDRREPLLRYCIDDLNAAITPVAKHELSRIKHAHHGWRLGRIGFLKLMPTRECQTAHDS